MRLAQFLISSLLLLLSASCSASPEKDVFTYQGEKSDLLKFFKLETEFLPDGLFNLRFDRSGLDVADEKQCSVVVYLRYLSGETMGAAFSSMSLFNESRSLAIEIIDKSLKYDGSIYLAINIDKGSCALDSGYNYSKSYHFSRGVLKELVADFNKNKP
ncbi:MAG: hypothetical protein JKY66_05165 [Spongiibacteraceae bacterium]|nr:hypothetical protein [Spongiibacteraceae bacterium]